MNAARIQIRYQETKTGEEPVAIPVVPVPVFNEYLQPRDRYRIFLPQCGTRAAQMYIVHFGKEKSRLQNEKEYE